MWYRCNIQVRQKERKRKGKPEQAGGQLDMSPSGVMKQRGKAKTSERAFQKEIPPTVKVIPERKKEFNSYCLGLDQTASVKPGSALLASHPT